MQNSEQSFHIHREILFRWFVAVIVWAAHLFFSYAFVEWYCQNTEVMTNLSCRVTLLLFTAICFVIAFVSTLKSFKITQRNVGNVGSNEKKSGKRVQLNSTVKFIRQGGVFLSAFLTIAILVQGIPIGVLPLCR